MMHCAGLLDDLPDGTEERKLQDLEQHVRAQGAEVKTLKQQAAKVCHCMTCLSGSPWQHQPCSQWPWRLKL